MGREGPRRGPVARPRPQARHLRGAGPVPALVALRLAARPVPRRARLRRGERRGGAGARALPHPDRFDNAITLPRGVIAFDFVFTLLALIAARALARTIFERPRPGFLLAARPGGADHRRRRGRAARGARDAEEALAGLHADAPPRRRPAQAGHAPGGRARARAARPTSTTSCESSPPDEVVIAMPGAQPARAPGASSTCAAAAGVPVKTRPGRQRAARRRPRPARPPARGAGGGRAGPRARAARPRRHRRLPHRAASCW